jgi:glycosyltransferase involved in cell wall biosynthesis
MSSRYPKDRVFVARFLFYIPDVTVPVGGVNVIVEMVHALKSAGLQAEIFSSRQGASYPFYSPQPKVHFLPGIQEPAGRKEKLKAWLQAPRPKANNPVLTLGRGDYVVVPDVFAPWLPAQLPGAVCILLVQGYYVLGHAMTQPGWDARAFVTTLTLSDACDDMARMAGLPSVRQIPLAINADLFAVDGPKKPLISYMPRRRGDDARIITTLLRERGKVADFELRAIDQMSHDSVAAVLKETSIFLSFSELEGFGLPPAEAMAAGCLVVGYTGVGGGEYFTPDVGFPIPDGDLMTYVRTVEDVAEQCRASSGAVQAIRQKAAGFIRSRYRQDAFVERVRDVFGEIAGKDAVLTVAN